MLLANPLLEKINSPAELRQLDRKQLPQLAKELRSFLLNSVAKTGGHLSSNLGTIELTIALHYIFNTPEDRLVWDVGHQTYAHKILTGRRAGMEKLRMSGGISGFPKRSESIYDTFGVGHSSTSIAAALGMAVAAKQLGNKRKAVAIIGDGAMSAGMAFEGLNNAGDLNCDLLVILNDNDMSISRPVGALNRYLTRLLSSNAYNSAKRGVEKILGHTPQLLELARRAEEFSKGLVLPGTLFEEMGFNYVGPIDGHDLEVLLPVLENIRHFHGPQFLHVITQKGHGYELAESNPILYHGVSKFEPQQGIAAKQSKSKLTYTEVFSEWLCDQAAADSRLIAITPAMCEGSGLVEFAKLYPSRYFDVGIAEQHALTFAAGLAAEGLKPVVAIYSTFLQRAYDQLIHDIALQNLPVVFAIDRGGLVGADGATHHGVFDLSYLNCIPNMVIMAASDENECRQMLSTAYSLNQPVAVRYPRGSGRGVSVDKQFTTLPIGKGETIRTGNKIAILSFGSMLDTALKVATELDATVINMRFIKPLDWQLIQQIASSHQVIVSLEENAVIGGAGAEIARLLIQLPEIKPLFISIGLPDHFIDHGDQIKLLAEVGLDEANILQTIKNKLNSQFSHKQRTHHE